MAAPFDLFIGIDYSGAGAPTSRVKALKIFAANPGEKPQKLDPPVVPNNKQAWNWTRKEIADHLIGLAHEGVRYVAGIDHGLSFPVSYLERYGLKTWPEFLADFAFHWPTDSDHVYVDFVRDGALARRGGPRPDARVGRSDEFRLCERWTSSAKSVFQFDVQGQVAKSTHAGIPWIRRIREAAGDHVHIWPFDGWTPAEGKAVIAEVYPSLFRRRYPTEKRDADEHDAYAVARWLSESSARGVLARYFDPPLTVHERALAAREGWILGIT
jgi:hypothetical protein